MCMCMHVPFYSVYTACSLTHDKDDTENFLYCGQLMGLHMVNNHK